MIPLSKLSYLLKLIDSDSIKHLDASEYLSDILDILNYICKSENHVSRVASNGEIFKQIKTAVDHVKNNRHLVLHSAISIAASLLNDKSKRNYEIAHDKWGCDMEGFLLLEKVREKASKDTPTLLSKYSQIDIKSSGVKLKLLKDMNVASLIAEYFVELTADRLAAHTHDSILTFLLDLAEEKEYRGYMINRSLFVYLNELFTSKHTTKRLKEQVSILVATIASSVNPQSLSYVLQYFIVDILCHTIEDTSREIYIFESLLALTNFTGYNNDFSERVFFKNHGWSVVYGHIFDDNAYIGNSAIELLNNMILNEKVYERVMTSEGFNKQLVQLFGVFNAYIDMGIKDYLEKKKPPIDHSSHLVKIKTMLSILCIIDDVSDKLLVYMKKIKIQSLCSLYSMISDSTFLDDVTMKVKYILDHVASNKLVIIDNTVSIQIEVLSKHYTKEHIYTLSSMLC